MKKIFVIGTVLCLQIMKIYADPTLEERLEEAVNGSNTIHVSYLLRRLDRDPMALGQKKELVSDLTDLAQRVHESKKSRISLVGNTKDFTMSALGSLVGTCGLIYLGDSIYKMYRKYQRGVNWPTLLLTQHDSFLYKGSMSIVPAFLGAYLAYKGLTCSTQRAAIEQSRAIRNVLDEKKGVRL